MLNATVSLFEVLSILLLACVPPYMLFLVIRGVIRFVAKTAAKEFAAHAVLACEPMCFVRRMPVQKAPVEVPEVPKELPAFMGVLMAGGLIMVFVLCLLFGKA